MATQSNREQAAMSTFDLVTTGIDQHVLVAMAFDVIKRSHDLNTTADCQLAIIIITDRPVTTETVDVVNNGNSNLMSTGPAKLFVTSIVDEPVGYYDNLALRLTCDHTGIWNKVGVSCLKYSRNVILMGSVYTLVSIMFSGVCYIREFCDQPHDV